MMDWIRWAVVAVAVVEMLWGALLNMRLLRHDLAGPDRLMVGAIRFGAGLIALALVARG